MGRWTDDGCCPAENICECLPCKQQTCEYGRFRITEFGDGQPGSCCDRSECIDPDSQRNGSTDRPRTVGSPDIAVHLDGLSKIALEIHEKAT